MKKIHWRECVWASGARTGGAADNSVEGLSECDDHALAHDDGIRAAGRRHRGNRDYTFEILRRTRECMIHMPTADIAKQVVACGNVSGRKADKFKNIV